MQFPGRRSPRLNQFRAPAAGRRFLQPRASSRSPGNGKQTGPRRCGGLRVAPTERRDKHSQRGRRGWASLWLTAVDPQRSGGTNSLQLRITATGRRFHVRLHVNGEYLDNYFRNPPPDMLKTCILEAQYTFSHQNRLKKWTQRPFKKYPKFHGFAPIKPSFGPNPNFSAYSERSRHGASNDVFRRNPPSSFRNLLGGGEGRICPAS